MIVFNENSNDIQQILDQVKIGNNLKTIVVTSEDNFEVFLETLAQFQKNSHFILGTYENGKSEFIWRQILTLHHEPKIVVDILEFDSKVIFQEEILKQKLLKDFHQIFRPKNELTIFNLISQHIILVAFKI